MKAILATLSGIALIAFTYLCVTVAMAVHTNSQHTAALLMNASDTITKVNKTLDKINGKGGTLQQTTETIVRVKDLITLSQATLYKQQKSISDFDNEMSVVAGNVNIAVQAATENENAVSHQTVATLADIQADARTANIELQTLNTTTSSLNKAVVDADTMIPDVQATMVNVRGMTTDGKETTAMAKDWLHGILHPTWPERIKNAMLDILQHLPVP
jgi:hypothetical protein